jgi:hypothetical protein
MKKWLTLGAVVVVIMAWSGISSAYNEDGAWGLGAYPIVGVNSGMIVVDGDDGEWENFPTASIITTADMLNTLGGVEEVPPVDDLALVAKAAWTPDYLLVFYKITDDTLNIDETDMNNAWKDDDSEIIMDADKSGTYTGGSTGEGYREDMQQIGFHVPTPGGYPKIMNFRHMQEAVMQWGAEPPYAEVACVVEPEGAGHLSEDVTVNFEIKIMCWDFYSRDGVDASTQHTFAEGQQLGMGMTLSEADGGGRTHQVSTHGPEEMGCHTPEHASVFETLAATWDIPTAVETSRWGAVKALFR